MMIAPSQVQLTFHEACREAGIEQHYLLEIVQHGIVEPEGTQPADWRFDDNMLSRVQRACRLCRDLEIDLAATAMVMELLEERQRLRRENEMLQRRLERFLRD